MRLWRVRSMLQGLKKENGSFTLESTMVFPILLSLILLFILFGMYMYQKVVLYYAAASTAERAAFGWDNSFRDVRSGMLSEPKFDSLYWRLSDDEMLTSLFGIGGETADAVVNLPLEEQEGEDSKSDLPYRKMEKSLNWLVQAGAAYQGRISYTHGLLQRKLEVKLKQPLSLPLVEENWLKREPKTVATASIVDPVEFIRSVDLVRYFTTKLKSDGSGGGGQYSKSQAGKVLSPLKDDKSPLKQ